MTARWWSLGLLVGCLTFIWCSAKPDLSHSMSPSGNPGVEAPPEPPAPPTPPPPPPGPPSPRSETMWGDLMIYVPGLGVQCPQDPVTLIKCDGDRFYGRANGIIQGWVWTALGLYRYPAAQREEVYQKMLAQGYTTAAVHASCDSRGDGYHGLYPIDCLGLSNWGFGAGSGVTFGARQTQVLQELQAHGLHRLCAGVSTDGLTPHTGFDVTLCDRAMTDWDDYRSIACQVDIVHRTFPNALIYIELQDTQVYPEPDTCDPIRPTATNGPQWIAAMKARYPRLQGFLLDTSSRDAATLAQYTRDVHQWWGTLEEVLFETDTFRKHRDGMDDQAEHAFNDAILAQAPWLHGCMSGCTPR